MHSILERLRNTKRDKIIVIVCASVAVIALVIGLCMHRNEDNTEKTKDAVQPATAEDYQDIGNSSTASVSTDQTRKGESWTQMTDHEYGLSMEILEDGYTGEFVEDGTNETVKKVLALKFTNNGEKPIQYAEYVFGIENEPVSFKVTDLLPGESCIAQEMSRRRFKKKEVLELSTRVVVAVDALTSAQSQVLIVDNSDNTLTMMNLTEQELQNIKVFYKNYDEDLGCYLGGVTYSGTVEKIKAGNSITVAPKHFVSGRSVITGSEIKKNQ